LEENSKYEFPNFHLDGAAIIIRPSFPLSSRS